MFQSTGTASTYEEVRDEGQGLGLPPLGCEQWTSVDGSRARTAGGAQTKRKTTVGCSEQLAKTPLCYACGDYGHSCQRLFLLPCDFVPWDRQGQRKRKGQGIRQRRQYVCSIHRPSRREEARAVKAKEEAPTRTDTLGSAAAAANMATDSFSGSRSLWCHPRIWKRKSSGWRSAC